jgi:hypothetical protein
MATSAIRDQGHFVSENPGARTCRARTDTRSAVPVLLEGSCGCGGSKNYNVSLDPPGYAVSLWPGSRLRLGRSVRELDLDVPLDGGRQFFDELRYEATIVPRQTIELIPRIRANAQPQGTRSPSPQGASRHRRYRSALLMAMPRPRWITSAPAARRPVRDLPRPRAEGLGEVTLDITKCEKSRTRATS